MYALISSKPIEYNNVDDDNHIYIHSVARDEHYTVAVNVESNTTETCLCYAVKEYDVKAVRGNKLLYSYIGMAEGLYFREKLSRNLRLDYWKQDWVTKEEMIPAEVRHSANNDLGKILVELAEKSIADPKAKIITLGKMFGPKDEADWTFGFRPAQGVHDVHCNQCSPIGSRWSTYDKPYSDGAIFFVLPKEEKVVGVFTMFKS